MERRFIHIRYEDPKPGEIESIAGLLVVDWSTIHSGGDWLTLNFRMDPDETEIQYRE